MLTFVTITRLCITNDSNGASDIDSNSAIELNNIETEVYASLEGGSGKARIEQAFICKNNDSLTAKLRWSSPNYDYMIVDGIRYIPVNTDGNSLFEIPITSADDVLNVVADTTAMGSPHEIQYKITFHSIDMAYSDAENSDGQEEKAEKEKAALYTEWTKNHTLTGKIEREYATNFSITQYDNEYYILKIKDDDYYLLLNDGIEVPKDFPKEIETVKIPVDSTYIVSSSAINYYSSLDALNSIQYISLKSTDIDDIRVSDLVENGNIIYAGKYSAPDYEMLISKGCGLIVENTMIFHSPETLEKLRKLGFTVLVEYSNQETHPIGRMEWIKVFGLLTGKYEKAEQIFNEKKQLIENGYDKTGKKVAYFYINSSGAVVTRKNGDYIKKLIEIAGGEYVLDGNSAYDGEGTINVQAESFYKDVMDADYFIYNSSIQGEIKSIEELVKKCPVLKNLKAVKNKNVYCNDGNFYRSVMSFAEITDDINKMLNNNDDLQFLKRLSD